MRNVSFLIAIVAFSAGNTFADINWNVTFNDVLNNTNNGFDDPTLGLTRRNTFNSVLTYINTVLDHTGTVDFTVNNSQTDGTGFLASAGTFYFTGPNGFSNGLFFDHATTGIDPTGAIHDGQATFDFGYNWNSELDATAGTEFDLFTVSLHEVTHAMGFSSLVSPTGVSEISGGDPGVFSVLDSFLELGDGTDLFGPGGNFLGTGADLVSDDVFFNGANAVAANGGNPVKMYAPNPYESGSSISHVDTATFPSAVMAHAIAPGVEKRGYTALDSAILADIGWNITVAAVPEPSALLLVATGVIPLVSRRRRRARLVV